MTPRTRFDQALSDFCRRSNDRIATLALTDASARTLLTTVPPLLERALSTLDPAVEAAAQQNLEAYQASHARRLSESEGELSYARLHNLLQARFYTTAATDPDLAAAFQRDLERATAGHTPAAFAALGLERTLDVLGSMVAFAAATLGPDDAHVTAARLAHDQLAAARTTADRESGESALAMAALETARDEARRLYVAGRAVLEAALLLDGFTGGAGRFMPAIASIYRSAGGNGGLAEESVVDAGSGGSEAGGGVVTPNEA